jgi:hypothetical protein
LAQNVQLLSRRRSPYAKKQNREANVNIQRNMFLSGTAITLALTLTACASAPDRPERQLARAETGIEIAEENGAQEFGPAALERARNEYDQARIAADNGEYELALRLAQRAELDAELAMAQTNHGKASIALRELQDSIQTLRREIARNQAS